MGERVDVLISGAGIVGGALACALEAKGFSVALVDVRDHFNPLPQDSQLSRRSFAISYGSFLKLKQWGIWDFLQSPPSPIETIRVTQHQGGPGMTYKAIDLGYEALGFMVSSQDLSDAVLKALQEKKSLTFFNPEKIASWKTSSVFVEVMLEGGTHIHASLLIGAEGRHSPLREIAGSPVIQHTYHQTALVFTVEHSESHHNTAFEHFTSEGPLAFLPLGDRKSAVVWSLKKDIAEKIMSHPDLLLHALFQHFGWGLGTFQLTSEIQTYPLDLVLPLKTWGPRFALVGDAAHALHPVAGQGLNVGLRDVAALISHLEEAHQLGLDIGRETFLRQWATKRRFDQWSMACVTHGTVKLLGGSKILRPLWEKGFWLIDNCLPLKRKFILHAMGLFSFPD